MAPLRQAVVLLFQCFLIITATQDEPDVGELNERYKLQIWSLLDYLNADPNRDFNYRIYKYVNSAQKTDEILDVEIEVGADCLDRNKCSRAVLLCRGYVEYFSDADVYRALPGADCQVVWNDSGNGISEVSNANDEKDPEQAKPTKISSPCYGCPNEINKNAEGVSSLVNLALEHIESERDKKHSIVEVVSLHRQIVAGVRYILVAKIAPTLCPTNFGLINPELCPIDENATPEYCKIVFFQKPTFSTDDHIISNNCTKSQEFAPMKRKDDYDNEINGYQRPMNTDEPNFEQISQSGNMDGVTPERLAAVEAQIIPTHPSKLASSVETTKSVIDNSQLGVEDIPSLQSSTDDSFQEDSYNKHVTEGQKDDVLDELMMSPVWDDTLRMKRQSNPAKSSESSESSEEAAKKAQAANEPNAEQQNEETKPIVKRQAPPQSSESSESVEKTAQPVKRQAPPQSSESSESVEKTAQPVKRQAPPQSSESSEETGTKTTPENSQPVKRQATPPKSSESSESVEKTAQPVKRQAPPQSSESSEETGTKTAPENSQPVKRQAPPSPKSSESSESVEKTAQPVKRQAPSQSSESSESVEKTAQPVKRQAPSQSSESSEETGTKTAPENSQLVKRQAPPSPKSSESSESVEKTAQPVKRQAPSQSSESSEETGTKTAPENSQPVKRQAPPKSSESSESVEKTAQPVKRQADSQSSESSEETGTKTEPLERVKRGAKDSSSSSSSSSDEDNNNNKKNNDDDDDDDNGNDKKKSKHKGKHGGKNDDDDDDDDNGKEKQKKSSKIKNGDDNGNGNGDDCSSSSSSSSDEDNNGNGKNRRRRAAKDDDSSSSSSDDKNNDDDNGNGENNKHKEDIKNDNDDSSSSSDDDDKNRRKRDLVKPASDEKLVVKKVAEFAAKSLDDISYEHKLLKIESVKKLAFEGTIYHIRIRVAVMKCNTVCTPDGEKLCKLKIYVSPSGNMEVNKSHCHRIIPEIDKNRTDRLFEDDADEVDAFKDDKIKDLISLALAQMDKDAPEDTRFDVASVVEATKRKLQSSILYKVKANVVLTDCLEKKTTEFCGVLGSTGKKCEFVASLEHGDFNEETMYVKCDDVNTFGARSKRQIPGGASDARLDQNVIDLTKSSFLLADTKSVHDNKFKVLEILKATKQVVAGMKYKIKAKVAITDCPKDDERKPEDCGLLESVAPKLCDITIWDQPWLGEKGRETTVRCGDDVYHFPKSKVEKRSVPGGLDTLDSNTANELMRATVLQLDPHTPHQNKYKVVNVVEAKKQVVQGMLYKIKANLILSNCLKNDAKEAHLCDNLKTDTPKLCDVKIWDRPWLPNGRQTDVTCEKEQYSFTVEHPDHHKVSKRETLVDASENTHQLTKRAGLGAPTPVKGEVINELLSSTMVELDARTPHANKYKVIKVLDSSSQVISGFLYKITAELALSDCLKSDSKKYHECGTLADAKPEVCNIEIIDQSWLPNGRKTSINCPTQKYDFESDSGKKKSKRSVLVGAPVDNKEDVSALLSTTMVELDGHTTHTNKYKVVSVLKSTKQLVSGVLYNITAELALTDCKKTDTKELHKCGLLSNDAPEVCNIEIWDQPWLENGKKTTITCPSHNYEFTTNSKNRVKRQIPGAKTDLNMSDPFIIDLTKSSLLYLDSRSSHDVKYKIQEIIAANKQIVSGTKYYIKAKIVLSDCKKYDSKDPVYCNEQKDATPRICDIKIWDQPWERHGRKTRITCDTETYQYRTGRSSTNLLGHDNHDFQYSAFRKFMQDHGKVYNTKSEYKRRFKIFFENMKKVEVLEKNEQGTAIYGATKFADLTEEEFKSYLGYRPDLRAENEVQFSQAEIPDIKLPKEFDWRKKNVVTEVKNQEQCGSCWAFSVTGNVEGQYALKYNKLLEFSEQELVDCDKMDDGCNGGLMDNAYRAIEQMGGLELESDYPYDAKDERCHFNKTMSRVQLSGAVNISHDETDMAKWLVQNGPISIAINANAMQFYMGGVSHPLKFLCSPGNLDHGVLIVGYGVHKYPLFNRTLPYWTVKNSWGTSWGEQGYYRVYRGDGTCGVNQTPSSAIVA